jgi:hypothetical protein
MKNISNMLGNGNLTPKERALMLIQDDLKERMDGFSSLTEVDIYSLKNFKADWKNDRFSIEKYNELMGLWRMIDNVILDSQTAFMNLNIEYLRSHRLFTMIFYGSKKQSEQITKGILKDFVPQGLLLLLKNSGLDYKRTIYNLAYSNLGPVTQEDSIKLYPDCKTEHHYFLQELFLAKYLSDKKLELSDAEKKEIIDEIVNSFSWDYIEKMKALKNEDLWFNFFNGYFADIPYMYLLEKSANYSNIHFRDEEDLKRIFVTMLKDDEIARVKNILKSGIYKWLDEGLYTKEFIPACASEGKETCNNCDTTKTHKEIIQEWHVKYAEAEKVINDLVESGKLQVVTKKRQIHAFSFEETILTGESIFELEDTYLFVKEYREQVENLMPPAAVISLMQTSPCMDWYSELISIKKLFAGISKIIELDITPLAQKHLDGMVEELGIVNRQVEHIFERYESLQEKNFNFLINYYPEDMKIKLVDNKIYRLGIAKVYLESTEKNVSSECFNFLKNFMDENKD